jgi:Holliday junction DNA helicase RuvB
MAGDFTEVLGQPITSPADLNALLLSATPRAVLHVDEAQELDRRFQVALYLALDERKVLLQGGRSRRGPQSIPVADFTARLSTTDEHALLQPLRDRCRLVLRFGFYREADLTTLLWQRSRALRWPVDEGVFPRIAGRSRGTPRLALRLLQACRRVSRAEGAAEITLGHCHRAGQLEPLDALGLGPVERDYLRTVPEGSNRLNVLASRLGLPARTVSGVVEAFLLRAGLIVKDDGGGGS